VGPPGRDALGRLADSEVLAKDAAQVAAGKKDRAAAVPATQAILLAEAGEGAVDQGIAAGLPGGRLIGQPIHATKAWAEAASFKGAHGGGPAADLDGRHPLPLKSVTIAAGENGLC
jgi:hypothetical protein